MGNAFLQTALGLSPVVILFAALCLFSKKSRRRNILAAAASGALALTMLFVGLGTASQSASGTKTLTAASDKSELHYAYTLAGEDAADLASDVIKTRRENGVYTPDDTLALARTRFLSGDSDSARALYRKLGDSEEKEAVLSVPAGSVSGSAADNAFDIISRGIRSAVGDNKDENRVKAAQIAAYAEKAYQSYINGGSRDSEAEDKLDEIEGLFRESPELSKIPSLRLSRMKLRLIGGDYEGIAADVDENADYAELATVSELYVNGYIDAEDFSPEFAKADTSSYENVVSIMNDVYKSVYENKSRDEKEDAEAKLTALESFLKNPALLKTEASLAQYTKSSNASDKSKIYLQLAKIESFMGNDPKAEKYIASALQTAGDCQDPAYSKPMQEIAAIISNKNDPELLKNIASNTENAIANSTPVQLKRSLHFSKRSGSDSFAFTVPFNTYVSKARTALNIVSIDASGFPTVKAVLNASGDVAKNADSLKKVISVSDCGQNIENFTVEDISYSKANILICADVSGSMSGTPIKDLKNAIQMFIKTTDPVESIALVTFNSKIVDTWDFGTSTSALTSAVSKITANGNTNMYKALQGALKYFDPKPGEINSVILISDGADNHPASADEIAENVCAPYKRKGVSIYSLGLGNGVKGDYLTSFASGTGGSYVFASDSAQIESFFNSIRAQILNSYMLTYTAKDTALADRLLRVDVNAGTRSYDERAYHIEPQNGGNNDNNNSGNSDNSGGGNSNNSGGNNSGGNNSGGNNNSNNSNNSGDDDENTGGGRDTVYYGAKAIYGFEEKLIYRSDKERKLKFKGAGFEASDRFTLSLLGNANYEKLPCAFKDQGTYEVTIPGGIVCGDYNVLVEINGTRAVLYKGLVVKAQTGRQVTRFGDYVFTSATKSVSDSGITLSGDVRLGGWLCFKGDVTLSGSLESDRITLTANDGAYIHYSSNTAQNMALVYADKDLDLPAVDGIRIYSIKEDGETVADTFNYTGLSLPNFMRFDRPQARLLPDRIEISAREFTTDLPLQNKFVNGRNTFAFRSDISGSISGSSIDMGLNVTIGSKNPRNITEPVNFGNIPLLFSPDECELRLDNAAKTFSINYPVAMPYITNEPTMTLTLCWSWSDIQKGITLEKAEINAENGVVSTINTSGLTFRSFTLGAEAPSQSSAVTGFCSIGSGSLRDIFPGIENIVGNEMADAEIISAADVKFNFSLADSCIKAKTDLKFFGSIGMSGAELEIGKVSYSNILLGMDNVNSYGITAKAPVSGEIHANGADITMNGDGRLVITKDIMTLPEVNGDVSFRVRWWESLPEISGGETAMLGFIFPDNGDIVFAASAKDGLRECITYYSKQRGGDYGKKSL